MKTTKKLSLNEIKVESFITSMNETSKQTVNGGQKVGTSHYGLVSAVGGAIPGTQVVLTIACAATAYVEENETGNQASNALCGDSRNLYCNTLLNGCATLMPIACISAAINC